MPDLPEPEDPEDSEKGTAYLIFDLVDEGPDEGCVVYDDGKLAVAAAHMQLLLKKADPWDKFAEKHKMMIAAAEQAQ